MAQSDPFALPDQPRQNGFRQIFSLSDLWRVYNEWSCFGAGVPILLNSGDSVLQYYSPSLSALQIYTRKPNDQSRLGIGCTAKPESDCWSDDSDSDNKSVSFSNTTASTYATSDDSVSTSDHEIEADCLHHLYCHYNETSSPHDRVPLTLKISELAQIYPGLMEFQSLELSPYSWVAVAWYPIYQIPVTRNVKELSACFITYHTLSSFQGLHSTISENNDKFQCIDTLGKDHGGKTLERDEMALPPFAAATYKMHGQLWTTPETSDKEKIGFYLNAANSWLKHRKFQHHDFNFFISRR